jgi:hypothetical protein
MDLRSYECGCVAWFKTLHDYIARQKSPLLEKSVSDTASHTMIIAVL